MSKEKPQSHFPETRRADLVCDTKYALGRPPQKKICKRGWLGNCLYRAIILCVIGILFGSYWPVRAVLFLYKPGVKSVVSVAWGWGEPPFGGIHGVWVTDWQRVCGDSWPSGKPGPSTLPPANVPHTRPWCRQALGHTELGHRGLGC